MVDSWTSELEDCTRGANDGSIAFPEMLGRLSVVQVERYHTDLSRSEMTYYRTDGESHRVASGAPHHPASEFSSTGVQAAISATQSGQIQYPEFCERICAAGCAGYLVSLAGARVVYYGRTGETHVEHFPQAP